MNFRDVYRQTIRDRNWVIPFGKHKGTPLHEVMADDPHYLTWLHSQTAIIFSENLVQEIQEQIRLLPSHSYGGDDRNSGGGYGIWDDAGCHPGGPFDY